MKPVRATATSAAATDGVPTVDRKRTIALAAATGLRAARGTLSGLTTGTAEAGAQRDRAGGSVQAADQLRMRSAGSHVLFIKGC